MEYPIYPPPVYTEPPKYLPPIYNPSYDCKECQTNSAPIVITKQPIDKTSYSTYSVLKGIFAGVSTFTILEVIRTFLF